ncbi:MAG: DeoR family transcriptional regulator [Myxococcota bacterium]
MRDSASVGKKGRNEQLVRVLRLVSDLATRGGCDVYQLAERHETTTRTIRRDLAALESVGVPLKRKLSDGGRMCWWLDLDELRQRGLGSLIAVARVVAQPPE